MITGWGGGSRDRYICFNLLYKTLLLKERNCLNKWQIENFVIRNE